MMSENILTQTFPARTHEADLDEDKNLSAPPSLTNELDNKLAHNRVQEPLTLDYGKTPTESESVSLFGDILDWMLAPLLILWPLSIAVTQHFVHNIANHPFDQILTSELAVLIRQVHIDSGTISVNIPASTRALLHSNHADNIYFQITGLRGELLSGDREIPWPELSSPTTETTEKNSSLQSLYLRDDQVEGKDVRVAYTFIPTGTQSRPVLVQIAETRNKRSALTNQIVSGVLLPQFAIIPLAAIFVYLGISRAIRPLNRIQTLIRSRLPDDLAPIPLQGVPEELRPLIMALNDLMLRFEAMLASQQRFIANAAHQLKTPLTGLKTQAELALAQQNPAQLRRSIAQISQATDRAEHLITQLLQLARAQASREKPQSLEALDLVTLTRLLTGDWVPIAMRAGLDLGFEGPISPLTIVGISGLLQEMISNLIDNAIKYTPSGGQITVRLAQNDNRILLEVEDNGTGISAEERRHVFERFYKGMDSDKAGSGLGLAIVKEIADLHNASLELTSAGELDRGTCIRVIFHIQKDAENLSKI